MELNIGTNIKTLRTAKGLTQEQLAELLNVSSAAVSKWEAKNTYPDITMLFPLANVFGVSLDRLMGYDEAKTKEEIEKILDSYRAHHMNGEFAKAREILEEARKAYPGDYAIMHAYMWEKAGGKSGNDPAVLLKNQELLTHLCDCILNGCTDEKMRLDALSVKAKLLHAAGDTVSALGILASFPTFDNIADLKIEQLYGKETPEYRYWGRKNVYRLLDGPTNRLARLIRYDNRLSFAEKTARLETIGEAFSALRKQEGLEFFAIAEHMIFAELSTMLAWDGGDVKDIVRIREKQFEAIQAMTALSEKDEILKELLLKAYKTVDLRQWTVDLLTNAQHAPLAKLREDPTYQEMLARWRR